MADVVDREEGETSLESAGEMTPATPTRLPTLDIVTVNWNTGDYLRESLRSVSESSQQRFALGRVVVVDNASSDDSLDGIDDLPLAVHVVRNDTNRGFAAACNQGAGAGQGDLLLFLNPDTRLFPDTLDRSVAFMTDPENAHIGICGGRVVNEDGDEEFSCCRFPTLWMWTAKMLGLSQAFPRWIPTQRISSAELTASGVVDQVIGAYLMIRRPLYDALGGFDERFFVYLEDVDLAYRATQAGCPCYFLHDVPIMHTGRVSSEQVRGKRLFYLLRGRTEFARKHWPAWQAVALGSMIVTVELPVRGVIAIAGRQRDEIDDVREAASAYVSYFLRGSGDPPTAL